MVAQILKGTIVSLLGYVNAYPRIVRADVDQTPHNFKIDGWLLWFLRQDSSYIGLTIEAQTTGLTVYQQWL